MVLRRLVLATMGVASLPLVSFLGMPGHVNAARPESGGTLATRVSAQRPDPCGYRYAAWHMIQELSNHLENVAAGNVDSVQTQERDAYFIEKDVDTASDYGKPPGSAQIGRILPKELGDLDAAVDAADSGDSDGHASDVSSARAKQNQLWTLVKGICPWKGRAATWTGWLNQYGSQSGTTHTFTASGKWALDWDFWCPDEPGSTTQSQGNFIVAIYSAGGALRDIPVNKLSTSDGGLTKDYAPGSYYFKIVTECAWHVKAVRGQ